MESNRGRSRGVNIPTLLPQSDHSFCLRSPLPLPDACFLARANPPLSQVPSDLTLCREAPSPLQGTATRHRNNQSCRQDRASEDRPQTLLPLGDPQLQKLQAPGSPSDVTFQASTSNDHMGLWSASYVPRSHPVPMSHCYTPPAYR